MKKSLWFFVYAYNGMRIFFTEEKNAVVHSVIALIVILCGIMFQLSKTEWLFVVIAIGMVFTAEAFNTSLEELCDMLRATHDPHVAKIKDLAAGAVLLASITAAIIGIAVFAPHIFFA